MTEGQMSSPPEPRDRSSRSDGRACRLKRRPQVGGHGLYQSHRRPRSPKKGPTPPPAEPAVRLGDSMEGTSGPRCGQLFAELFATQGPSVGQGHDAGSPDVSAFGTPPVRRRKVSCARSTSSISRNDVGVGTQRSTVHRRPRAARSRAARIKPIAPPERVTRDSRGALPGPRRGSNEDEQHRFRARGVASMTEAKERLRGH